MEDAIKATSNANSVRAVLEGGPASIPNASRIQTVGSNDEKIKVLHYGGYEHFERTGELDENASYQQIVFRWTMRTKMAE